MVPYESTEVSFQKAPQIYQHGQQWTSKSAMSTYNASGQASMAAPVPSRMGVICLTPRLTSAQLKEFELTKRYSTPTRPHSFKDCFTALPSELLHMIFDCMLLHHEADKALRSAPGARDLPCSHPLDKLAATCTLLRGEINSWAVSVLTKYSSVTGKNRQNLRQKQNRKKLGKGAAARSPPSNALRGRTGLLSWVQKHCVFCGKASRRRAIFVNGLGCCSACDLKQWPGKITKTVAKSDYDLENHHLRPKWSTTTGLPKIRYGTYKTMGSVASMFLRSEVEMVARLVHADLEAHLAHRQERREATTRKREEKRAERMAEMERDRSSYNNPRECLSDESDYW